MNDQKMGIVGDGEDVEISNLPTPSGDFGALTAISRAEVDMQVTTARQFPRSIARFQKEAYQLATLDEETAESMFYSLPRKDPKTGKPKPIEGPSVRFAEVIAYSWGNLRFEGRVVEIGKEFITAQGMAWDLERNLGARIEVKRRITNSRGIRYNDDMIAVTGNAAVSIALRNAIFDVIPFALAKKVYEAAVKTAMGEHKPMEKRRSEIMDWFRQAGAKDEDVFMLVGVSGEADLTSDHLRTLVGVKSSVKSGERTLDDVMREAKGETQSAGAAAMNQAAAQSKPTEQSKPAEKAPEPEDKSPASKEQLEQLKGLLPKAREAAVVDSQDEELIASAQRAKDGPAVRQWIRDLQLRIARGSLPMEG